MAQETPAQRAAEIKTAIMNEKQANELQAFGKLELERAWNNARDSISNTSKIKLETTVTIAISGAGCTASTVKAEKTMTWTDHTGKEISEYTKFESDEPLKSDLNPDLLNLGGK